MRFNFNIGDFFRRSPENKLECKRLVKYDGTKFEVAGIDIHSIKIGKIGVEPVLQTVSQTLLLLDHSQYNLCLLIRSIKDEQQREEYKRRMIDDKLHATNIIFTLDALAKNPNSQVLQNVMEEILLAAPRAIEIERSTDNQTEKAIRIGNTSFKEKIEGLATFYDKVIKKLDKMLDNPGFTRMYDPEESDKVHDTLVEIDKEIENNIFIERSIINEYRRIRGPWKELYETDAKTRRQLVYGVRDFRNLLAKKFNELSAHIPDAGLGQIEINEKEYKIL